VNGRAVGAPVTINMTAGYDPPEPDDCVSRFARPGAPIFVGSRAVHPPPVDFDLEGLRGTPALLGEFERLVARWSVAPPVAAPFLWPAEVDAPPDLKVFYTIAHHWPGARLDGSQDFLRPLDKLARDGGKLTFLTENQGNFRIAAELAGASSWILWACTFGQTSSWVPMDGVRLGDLLVTFGVQELMFGARYLTAHSTGAIERCRIGGGFVPLWRGTYAGDIGWNFMWHPAGAIAGRLDGENWYWCGQARQGRLWTYLGEPAPNLLSETAAR